MKKYKCPRCNKIMNKVDEIYLNDEKIKYGLECGKHPGITYYIIEKITLVKKAI